MSNQLRRPGRLTSLPPVVTEPPPDGEPHRRRVHIIIELVPTVARKPQRAGLFWWLILGLILLAVTGHAQPPTWIPELPPADEQQPPAWSSTTWSNGVTTYTNIYTGQGRVQTCTSYTDVAGISHTDCGPSSP